KVKEFKDIRINLIAQNNSGVSKARNRGLQEAKYNWVCLLDGDDLWHQNYLRQFAKCIFRDESYIAYACASKKVQIDNSIWIPSFRFVPRNCGEIKNYYKASFFGSSPINSSGICLNRKRLLEQNLAELFPSGVKRGEDLDA